MSRAAKQVDWCIGKARKEIEECKKMNVRERHRGLLKVDTNLEEAKKHIEKAEYNLSSALDFAKTSHSDWSVSAFFYSLYHCFLSIGYKFGYKSGNQSCTISLMEYLKEEGKINIDSKFIEMFKYEDEQKNEESSLIGLREDYTYGTKKDASKEKIEELKGLCIDLIEETKIIYNSKE